MLPPSPLKRCVFLKHIALRHYSGLQGCNPKSPEIQKGNILGAESESNSLNFGEDGDNLSLLGSLAEIQLSSNCTSCLQPSISSPAWEQKNLAAVLFSNKVKFSILKGKSREVQHWHSASTSHLAKTVLRKRIITLKG